MSFHQNPLAGEGEGGFRVWSWQYHVASIGISVTWFINMILVGKVPKLGIYIHMFLAVGSRWEQFDGHYRDVPKPVPNHVWSFETCLNL